MKLKHWFGLFAVAALLAPMVAIAEDPVLPLPRRADRMPQTVEQPADAQRVGPRVACRQRHRHRAAGAVGLHVDIVARAKDGGVGRRAEAGDRIVGREIEACIEARRVRAVKALRGRPTADDAAVVIKTPNYASWNRRFMGLDWCGFHIPAHCNYFTPATLAKMLRKVGFEPMARPLLDRLPTSDSLWIAARKPE